MLKLRRIKSIAFVLIATLVITLFGPYQFSSLAESGIDYVEAALSAIANCADEIAEARADNMDLGSVNDWNTATKVDHLPWNFFHICVQLQICNLYGTGKEKRIYFKQENDGKLYGSADLYKKIAKTTYLWEVKPISYKYGGKRAAAEAQLGAYVTLGKPNTGEKFALGDKTIASGSMNVPLLIPRVNGVEEVVYQINWYDEGGGIILYTFRRSSNGLKKQEQEQPETETSKVAEKKEEAEHGYATDTVETGKGHVPGLAHAISFYLGLAAVASLFVAGSTVYSLLKKNNQVAEAGAALASRYLAALAVVIVTVNGTSIVSEAATDEQIEELDEAAGYFLDWLFVLYGENYVEELKKALEENNEEKIEELTEQIQDEDKEYEDASSAAPPRDPLIIDFGNSGIELTTMADGVNFDLDSNGFAERTAWIGTEDGFLAYDKNDNGKIDNGGELFGDKFLMENGKISKSGFEALKSLDQNDDGIINVDDECYSNLSVWIDRNHNGKTDNEELVLIKEMGIESINTTFVVENNVDLGTGTMCAEYSNVILADGERKIGEFWFPVKSSNTTHGDKKTAGNVPNLLDAVEADASGNLEQLCLAFEAESDIAIKHKYLKEILYTITNANSVSPDSRGGNIDARDLHVIEQFMGRKFEGVDGDNPNAPAAEILKNMYNDIENIYYNILNMETEFGGLTSIVGEYFDEKGNRQIYYDSYDLLIARAENGEIDKDSVMLVYDIAMYLKEFDKRNKTTYLSKFTEKYATKSEEYSYVLKLATSGNTYLGTEANDTFNGTGYNDFVFGLAGDDKLSGGKGTDYIYGGQGNDVLDGGEGVDYYFIEQNHGNDVISDGQGNSNIIFSDDLEFDSYSYRFTEKHELVMNNDLTNESIVLSKFINSPLNYNIQFGDEVRVIGGGTESNFIEGTSANDKLSSKNGLNIFEAKEGDDLINGGEYMDIAYGGDGNDQIYGANGINLLFGGNGNDTIYDGDNVGYLYGEAGDDTILAGGGSDYLDGGTGNDILQGDHGDDIYVYRKGYNSDVIIDPQGDNIIRIYGYSVSDMKNSKNAQKDLIIEFGIESDKLVIQRFFEDGNNKSFTLKFEDGTVLEKADIVIESAVVEGTANDDWLNIEDSNGGTAYGRGGNDGINGGNGNDKLYGNEGNDKLYGNEGDDTLDGGEGNDTLDGGNGNDTFVYGMNYGNDTFCDWNGDSIVKMTDIDVRNIVVSEKNNSDLIITIKGTENTLTISGYRWLQGKWTFEFANNIIVSFDKATFKLVVISGDYDPDEEAREEATEEATTEETTTEETTTEEATTEETTTEEATTEEATTEEITTEETTTEESAVEADEETTTEKMNN